MIVLTRDLKVITNGGEVVVPVQVYRPVDEGDHWRCWYDIGWPENPRSSYAAGIDSVQSLLLALQKIGAELYTSDAHRSGKLIWLERGVGYGFPVPTSIQDLYEGDDKLL